MTLQALQQIWQNLSPSARIALFEAAEDLARGYTGNIEFCCHKGGVRRVRQGKEWTPGEREHLISESGGGG